MGDQTPPLDPFEPTGEDLARARTRLASIEKEDLARTVLNQLTGRLDVIKLYADPLQAIREMRAAVAAYDERKAAGS